MEKDDVKLWTGHVEIGRDKMIDIYIVSQRDMAAKGHPIMQGWGV
jgi:hypothetical protein